MLALLSAGAPFQARAVTLSYKKGWNKAAAHGRTHGHPARPRHNGTDDFSTGWNDATFYSLHFGRSPPMLRHNVMHEELAAQRYRAILETAKSEDIAVRYT